MSKVTKLCLSLPVLVEVIRNFQILLVNNFLEVIQMLMVRSDILLLSDEEILASLGAYKKSRSLNDAKNAENKIPAVERNKN